ncbi:hypothetical protein V865_001542 [Kwoniella europaea PYCC6329]|uniref:Uncharacterized protein n=1 Tax=Kwoniella europaea PYCC6329 TaxID=1423913 RepID=A0AAX4KDE0_9TREE
MPPKQEPVFEPWSLSPSMNASSTSGSTQSTSTNTGGASSTQSGRSYVPSGGSETQTQTQQGPQSPTSTYGWPRDTGGRMSEQSSNRTSTTSSYNGASGGTSSDTGASQTTTNTGDESTKSDGLPEDWEELRRDKIKLEAANDGIT